MSGMRPYAEVIGDPIDHSRSPDIYRRWLNETRIDADYRATRVRAEELKDYLDRRRRDPAWRGCNVTAPLKQLAFALTDELSDRARAVGAINIIAKRDGRLIGDNSDVEGIAAAVAAELVGNKPAILIGAGGAARAALHFLDANSVGKVQVMARSTERALSMRMPDQRCPTIVTDLEGPRFVEPAVVINASPIGMAHAPPPAGLAKLISGLIPGTLFFDMVYEPVETELMKAARRSNLPTVGGLIMLEGQAMASFSHFFGNFRVNLG